MSCLRLRSLSGSLVVAVSLLALGLLAWGGRAEAACRGCGGAQIYWGHRDPPVVVFPCTYEYVMSCWCFGQHVGDTVRGCSEKSVDDAVLAAKYACTEACEEARREWWHLWQPWGVMVVDEVPLDMQPGGLVEAIEPGLFQGHVPDTGEMVGPMADIDALSYELQALTGSPAMWLAGPPEYYVCQEP
jgi:hypothetical protein